MRHPEARGALRCVALLCTWVVTTMGCGRPGEAPDSGISLQRGVLREGIVEVGMLTGAIESVRFGNGAAGSGVGTDPV